MSETIYLFRQLEPNLYTVAKFSDGRKRPDEVYQIHNTTCSCFGSRRGTRECKHTIMFRDWLVRGKKVEAIDYDNGEVHELRIFQA